MQKKTYVPFTKEMKKDYTILVPNMLPMHFKLIVSVLRTYGYNMELLETTGPHIAETGLKYTHNDACYPAVLVIGQFMDALLSGKYDPDKTALIMFQSGGGCRASNYISLIRKALKRAGLERVPVISFSITGLEYHPGFVLTPSKLHALMYCVLYGDLLMSLVNQVRPYECHPGDAEKMASEWTQALGSEMGAGGKIRYKRVKRNYAAIIEDFARIPVKERDAVKVGIVGEIFVKYSPLGNNDLERFLIREGAETVVPGLMDFILFIVYNTLVEYEMYGRRALLYPGCRWVYDLLCRKKNEVSALIGGRSAFRAWTPFRDIVEMAKKTISVGVKMGEGWLLAAEMVELSSTGCKNIVCAQPFGCLPNHICGKGMMKPILEKDPGVNIVAIDYDPGASRVNQENRLKLMLSNARRNKEEEARTQQNKTYSRTTDASAVTA